ncbi:MAG TPA: hypothetical protein DCE23_04325 [Firmicutes bacterium]|nr:hypothetical protein [Bacillota bacterium]
MIYYNNKLSELVKENIQNIGVICEQLIPENWGFVLMVYPHREKKSAVTYVSNSNREDVITTLKEFVDKVEPKKEQTSSAEDYNCLVGKYLNGYKITKVLKDPFISEQFNLLTDEWEYEAFNDRSLVMFRISNKPGNSKIYQELVNKENHQLKNKLQQQSKIIDECIKELRQYNFYCQPLDKLNRENDDIVFNVVKILEKLQQAKGDNNDGE